MTITTETPYFTVEQASRWLTCAQPVPLPLLQRLGKDCSMVCRIRGATFVDVPVQGKNWPTERGYPAAIIQEVFQANPDTRAFLPGAKPVPTPAAPVPASAMLKPAEVESCPCGLCGKPTLMTGTKRCDNCWEMEGRIRRSPDIARKILAELDV